MTNKIFIEKYGKHNFYDIIEDVNLLLCQYKYDKTIRGYKLYSRKGYATIFNNGGSINLEIATIWNMKKDDFKKIEYKGV